MSGAGCFYGKGKISMADGTLKTVENLQIGDVVLSLDGTLSTVTHIIKSRLDKQDILMQFSSGLLITGWHPIYVYDKNKCFGKWRFPNDLIKHQTYNFSKEDSQTINLTKIAKAEDFFVEDVFSISTENGVGIIIDGITAITLGHGIVNDSVASHEYLGSQQVLNDINSLGTASKYSWKRNHVTRLINGIEIDFN